ncbi:MAG: hypothetical protein HQK62_13005 [Desulfamplus sp.]|nr:hypothetical protein [Desulfamplus sp.]
MDKSKSSGGTEIVDLELFAEKRTPRQIKGSSTEVASKIARVLREEVKVI